MEPIQAEGGVLLPNKEYFKELKALCEKKNVLLIADEVQTGLGRTGKLFAYQNFGFEPDMMTLGKGLGGGLPLSAVVISEKIEDVYTVGDHGTTMGGNPVACAAGYATLKQINTKPMLKAAMTKGSYIMKSLMKLNNPRIKDVRGMGLI
ncbi:aminotransferase class III-fold pyridoxal phosphate-dependent enzyme, partial [Candidatus Aquicultor sp.]